LRRCRNLRPAPVKENKHKKKHRTNAPTPQRKIIPLFLLNEKKPRQKKAAPQLAPATPLLRW